jgi:hypothetical protein
LRRAGQTKKFKPAREPGEESIAFIGIMADRLITAWSAA